MMNNMPTNSPEQYSLFAMHGLPQLTPQQSFNFPTQNLVFVPPVFNNIVDDLQPAPLRRWSCESAQAGGGGGGEKTDGRGGAARNEGTLPASSYYHNLSATNHLHMSNIEQRQEQVVASGFLHHPLPHQQQVQPIQCIEPIPNQMSPREANHRIPQHHLYRDNELFENDYYAHNVRSVSAPSIGNNGYVGGRGMEFGARRRFRTNFTEQQSLFLEDSFRESHYPDHKSKKDMANYLNIPEDRITVWFQNRRAKWRRKEIREKERSRSDNCGPSCSFDYPCYPSSSDSSAFLPPTFPILNNFEEHQYQDLKPELLENQAQYSISSSNQ